MTIRYGSVCSGIEAATAAWHILGWQPVFFSEIEPFPSAVLAHRYGSNMPGEPLAKNGIPNHGDFTQIGEDAGPIDLLVGGTPCQSFSVAGKRLGLDDPRGNLALEYLALARRLRARWIVWENVPGVLSSVSDEEDGEGGIQPGLEGRQAGDEWTEESDFATFLEFVRECGYGFAYRVLDAQYVRVDGFARAVPQRRRRVFVVGYLGDWRPAAAVLLEPEGMRGDSAPRRQAGQGSARAAARSVALRGRDGGSDIELGDEVGHTVRASSGGADKPHVLEPTANALRAQAQDPHDDSKATYVPVAFGGGNTSAPLDVSTALTALTAHGRRRDFEVETFIAEIAATLPAGGNVTGGERQPGMGAETAATMLVAHALRGEGFDASEDGTGRGTPIVPICFNSREDPEVTFDRSGALGSSSPQAQAVAYGFLATDAQVSVSEGIMPTLRAASNSEGTGASGNKPAVAYGMRSDASRSGEAKTDSIDGEGRARKRDAGFNIYEEHAPTLDAGAPHAVSAGWAVRRLTPVECERLQGFDDDFTNVPWRGKQTAPDGPRYKTLGNSMAVNVMRWIGLRIDLMEGLIRDGRVVPEAAE